VGFTGHKDPAIHLDMLSHGYPFDTCQLGSIAEALEHEYLWHEFGDLHLIT
jgi:hypothetical protein